MLWKHCIIYKGKLIDYVVAYTRTSAKFVLLLKITNHDWRLYCQFLTYIVCLNGVTVAYCKVLVNNIIVTVSVLQGTNNICFKCIFYNEWYWLLASARFQWKLLKTPFEVHSEIPKIEILFRKLKKVESCVAYGFVQF